MKKPKGRERPCPQNSARREGQCSRSASREPPPSRRPPSCVSAPGPRPARSRSACRWRLTGALGSVGQQQKRGAEFYAKLQNAKGGILGRPIELLIEDTAGNPANCVRKAQEMVERHDCRLLTGITLSSEALAVVPKLAEWDSIFISSDNGDGRLTAESLRAELLPRQHLGSDGHARGVALSARRPSCRSSMRWGSTTPGATTACRSSRTR